MSELMLTTNSSLSLISELDGVSQSTSVPDLRAMQDETRYFLELITPRTRKIATGL